MHKKKKKNYKFKPTLQYKSFITQKSIATIICINNTMDIAFLVQIRQSSKCGKTRNNKIFNLYSGSGTSS